MKLGVVWLIGFALGVVFGLLTFIGAGLGVYWILIGGLVIGFLTGFLLKQMGKSLGFGFLSAFLGFTVGGIAFNATYCRLGVGTLALLGVLLTSYMGTQAQAVGQGRAYGGVLGRADRLVLLFFGGLIQLLVAPSGGLVAGVGILQFGPLEWFMVLFAVLGNATAVQRAVGIWRGLAAPR